MYIWGFLKTSDFCDQLTRLIPRKDFIEFNRLETYRSYVPDSLFPLLDNKELVSNFHTFCHLFKTVFIFNSPIKTGN